MKYLNLFLLLIGFVFISCNEDKSKVVKDDSVSDEECIQFLNEVLSDTVNLKLIPSKKVVIANWNFTSKNVNSIEIFSKYGFLYEILEEKDSVFVKNQYDNPKSFNPSELKNYGFQIFDLKSKMKNFSIDSVKVEIEKINILNRKREFEDDFIMLRRPIVNRKRDKILLRIDYINSGIDYLLIKKNNTWEKKKVGAWMN